MISLLRAKFNDLQMLRSECSSLYSWSVNVASIGRLNLVVRYSTVNKLLWYKCYYNYNHFFNECLSSLGG